MIGVFSLPIGDLMLKLRETRDKELKKLRETISHLETIQRGKGVPALGNKINTSVNESINSSRTSSNNMQFKKVLKKINQPELGKHFNPSETELLDIDTKQNRVKEI